MEWVAGETKKALQEREWERETKKQPPRGEPEVEGELRQGAAWGEPGPGGQTRHRRVINHPPYPGWAPPRKAPPGGGRPDLWRVWGGRKRPKGHAYQAGVASKCFGAILAKLRYTATDGTERTLEAGFTRYSVVFTGERLPDGTQADAVYLILNEPYWDVLNHAPTRPLGGRRERWHRPQRTQAAWGLRLECEDGDGAGWAGGSNPRWAPRAARGRRRRSLQREHGDPPHAQRSRARERSDQAGFGGA